jgi:predicted outer membrane repeat protein/parallel beta-helix repeat protein
MKKLLVTLITLLVGNLTHAETLSFHFDDPVGDSTGIVDVVSMDFTFNDATGAYTILLTADAAKPFFGNFRINVNLFNPDTGTTAENPSYFRDVGNDYDLSTPVATIELTGTNTRLIQWKEGHRVATSSEPFGNFDYCAGFGCGVGNLPGLSEGDAIAGGDFTFVGEPRVIPPGPSETLHVPGDYPTLRRAMWAAKPGDQIEVAPGTYYERIHFDGKALRLYSSAGPAATTIDGGETGTVVYCNSSVGADTVLEGFTITGVPRWAAGSEGMFNYFASPTVVNCVFSGNLDNGMFNYDASPTVINCTFTGNSATYSGGGMYNSGSSPTVTNCTFSSNSATTSGGGICNFSSSPTVSNCTFESNTATQGGGIYNYFSSSPTITNCTFTNNSAGADGGGICNDWSATSTMVNCIVWANSPHNVTGSAIITYSAIQGGWAGVGNIDADPLFEAATLHLSAGSPCIDAGTNSPAGGLPATDLDGNPRCLDGNGDGVAVVDMGAYEYGRGELPTITLISPTDNQTVCGNTVTVEGTATDDVGIASITINGQEVSFDPTENPVHFSHEISLAAGANLITIVVADVEGTQPVVLTITVISQACNELPDLAISADDIQLLPYEATDSTITIDAAIRNVGTATASAVTVRFYEFNTLLAEAEVVEIPAGDMRSVPITIPMPAAGERLIRVVLDPLDTVKELDETNNEATQILLINTGDITAGYILITGSVPFSVCRGSSFSVTGTAVYDLYVDGVRYTDYAVKGGMVEMTVIGPDGEQWLYGGHHTNIYGAFSQVLQAPGTLGIYRLLITVTDNTFMGECELVFEVKDCSISPPPPGPPYPPGGGGSGSGSGYWAPGPPGGGSGSTTDWHWVWITPPPNVPAADVYVYSEHIHFSITHPDIEQEITIFAEIHYWAQSTDLVAHNVPINIYATYPGEDKIKIGETLIDELTVGWPDFGAQYVFTTWEAHREGIYIIEVEVDPSYSEQNMLNNAATRAIIVGDLGHPWGAIEGQVREALGGVDGVIMDLYNADQTILLESRVTDHGGYYLFANLPAGTYQVHIRVPDGYVADAPTKPAEVVAQSITTVNFFLSQTAAPVADAGGPYSGEVGVPVTLDASGSYDPDGVIVRYEWDCNGDGEYDQITSSSQMPYTWDTTYNGIITLRVTDNDGLTATDTATVSITSPPLREVGVDIYPNRIPNPVYLSRNYTIYVAVLGSATFDVTTLDATTVRFGRNGTEASPVREPALQDVNSDGFIDALYGFSTFACGFATGDAEGHLTGSTTGGATVAGSDSVVVAP